MNESFELFQKSKKIDMKSLEIYHLIVEDEEFERYEIGYYQGIFVNFLIKALKS